jgi:hypothetical protein
MFLRLSTENEKILLSKTFDFPPAYFFKNPLKWQKHSNICKFIRILKQIFQKMTQIFFFSIKKNYLPQEFRNIYMKKVLFNE